MAGVCQYTQFSPDATRSLMANGYGLGTGLGCPLNPRAGSALGIGGHDQTHDSGHGLEAQQNIRTFDI